MLRTWIGPSSKIGHQLTVPRRSWNGVRPIFHLGMVWDQSSRFVDEGCLFFKLSWSQPWISSSGKSWRKRLLFQTQFTGFAENNSGEGMGRNFNGNDRARPQEFPKESERLHWSQRITFWMWWVDVNHFKDCCGRIIGASGRNRHWFAFLNRRCRGSSIPAWRRESGRCLLLAI